MAKSPHSPRGPLPLVGEFGAALHARWLEVGYRREAFPDLAHEALRQAELHRALSPEDIVRWVFESECLPPQHDLAAKFGQPPVTLFHDDRFSISAIYWMDVDTSIHQHRFSGAYSVLRGSSLQRTYRPEEWVVDSDAISHGRLVPLALENVGAGEGRRIEAGSGFVHSVLHLDVPTVSLVVRTHGEKLAGPQWTYHRSGVAVDPFYESPTLERTLQLACTLAQTEHADLPRRVAEFVQRADPWSVFRMLHAIDDFDFGRKASSDAYRRTRERFGPLGDAIVSSVYDSRSTRSLAGLRSRVEEDDLRFFLSAALCAHGREELFALLRGRSPELDPTDQVLDALRTLLPIDARAAEIAGPGALRVAREVLSGRSFAELLAAAPDGTAGVPAKEIARLSLVMPSMSLFRPILAAAR